MKHEVLGRTIHLLSFDITDDIGNEKIRKDIYKQAAR
jgi:hypothetical protein